MKLLSKLLIGTALATATTATAQVEYMNLDDNAIVTIARTIDANGESTYSIINHNPDLLEDNGDLTCTPDLFPSERTDAQCRWHMTLKTDYPGVPFSQFPELNSVTSNYGYVDFIDPLPRVDLEQRWNGVPSHLAEVITNANTDINAFDYKDISIANINIAMLTQPGVPGTDKEIIVTLAMDKPLETNITQYQSVQLIATGIAEDLELFKDGQALGENYFEATANKGIASVIQSANPGGVIAWLTDYWNQSSGHYTELRMYTNGTSRHDQGLDLSEYNTVTLRMQCTNTMTVELFLGSGEDSSQNFLGDINCDTYTNDFTFDISGFNNLQDIQTALWFHIPTWKNTGLNEFRLFMNVHEAILKR